MSSAFKTLKTSDVTVAPYKTNKSWSIPYTTGNAATYSIDYIVADQNTGTLLAPTEAQLYYRSIRQLYYSNYLPSISPNIPLSEQDYNQLEEDQTGNRKTNNTLGYNNYLQSTAASGSLEVDNRFKFPTGSGEYVGILSIPQNLYGEYIQPGSFIVTENGSNILIDDSNGNIIDGVTPAIHVGNILYSHGIIVITNQNYTTNLDPNSNQVINFKSTFTIYENQIRCHVNENEFNFTQNPTSTLNSDIGVDATAEIVVSSYGSIGDTVSVYVTDPVYGYIYLGGYTVTVSDTTTAILATNIAAALNTNIYGYTASANSSTVTITARTGLGSSINGGSRLVVNYTLNTVETFDYTFDNTFQ